MKSVAALRRNLVYLAALALLCAPQSLLAENAQPGFEDFDHSTWSLESGLPQRSVMAIAQDQGRYLWLGTQHGLTRFDGLRFREYAVEDHPELAGNDITSLLNDSADRLWIGTRKGLSLRSGGAFRKIGISPGGGNGGDVVVDALLETTDGAVLAGTNAGLFRIELEPIRVQRLLPDRVGALALIDDRLWVGGLGRYWTAGDPGDNLRETALPEALESVLITDLVERPDSVWLATTNGLFRLVDGEVESADLHPGLNDAPITATLVDRREERWFATAQALFRLRGDDSVERIDDGYPNYHPQIQALFEDLAGNLWMGSSVDGLARFRPGRADRYSRAEGLHETLTWSLESAGDGTLWIGTADGLTRLVNGRHELVLAGQSLPHPHAYTLHREEDRLWIGTRRGLVRFDPATGNTELPDELRALDALQINGIVPAGPYGRMFFLTGNGLHLWHEDARLEHLDAVIGSRSVRQLRTLPDQRLLVATENGVFAGRPGRFEALDETKGLPSDLTAMATHVIDENRIIIGSMDRGLFTGSTEGFRRLGRGDGLPSDSSYFITHDRNGFLWVAGFEGVYRVPLDQLAASPQSLDAQMLISESGQHRGSQQGFCCNGAGHAKGLLREDGLWLPTRDGVIRLRPGEVDFERLAPALHIDRIRIGDQWQPARSGQILQPALGERNLAFEFSAISLADPRGVRVRYRIAGVHDWRDLASIEQPRVEYTSLSPGRYRFEIMGNSASGAAAPQTAAVELDIPAHFHETAAFVVVLALAFIILLWLAYRWRKHQWQQRQQMLEAEVTRQTEALRRSNAQLQDANRALKRLSERDSLTGLFNRRHLDRHMPHEVKRLQRQRERAGESDAVIGFALIDVDHFKTINDQIGHGAGDRILEEMGERLRQLVRETDHAVRWGGEEFLIVLPNLRRDDAAATLKRLHSCLRDRPYRIDEERSQAVTVSVGYAELPHSADADPASDDWEITVELADRALYQVKQHGRDGWAILRPRPDCRLQALLRNLRGDMSGSLARGDIQIDIHTNPTGTPSNHDDD